MYEMTHFHLVFTVFDFWPQIVGLSSLLLIQLSGCTMHHFPLTFDLFICSFVVAWVALLYEKVSKVTELLSIFSNVPFDVLFHVYGKKEQESQWIMCVACSQEHHSKRVNDFLTEDGHEKIERAHYNEGLFIGTKMKVSLRGSLYTTDDKIPLK